jgi:hypothetical protein
VLSSRCGRRPVVLEHRWTFASLRSALPVLEFCASRRFERFSDSSERTIESGNPPAEAIAWRVGHEASLVSGARRRTRTILGVTDGGLAAAGGEGGAKKIERAN